MLKLKLSLEMGKKGDLSDFERSIVGLVFQKLL